VRPALASVAALALALAAGCGADGPRRPHVVLVVVDTLRADRLGCYGNERGLTPFLDELCAGSVVFERAYAPSSWTLPSVASLFTSRYAVQHGVERFDNRLADAETTLAERLSQAGYATGGFSANMLVKPMRGYAQGFDEWQVLVGDERYGETADLPTREVTPAALHWLDRALAEHPERPVLLYLQYMEPHSPYDPPEPFRSRFAPDVDPAVADEANELLGSLRTGQLDAEHVAAARRLYDAEVAAVDWKLRRLFAGLARRGVLEDAVVVVTSDHGEEFREHDRLVHGHTLYEAAVHVPLLLRAPGFEPGRVATPVSLVDLAPTLVDLAGAEPGPSFEGRSLVPLLEPTGLLARLRGGSGGDEAERDVLLELPHKGKEYFDIRAHQTGLVRGDAKLVVTPAGETALYDLGADPGESDPDTGPAARKLREELEATRAALRDRAGHAGAADFELDPQSREELRALGYAE